MVSPDFRINYGQSFDYFKRISVTATTFGSSADGYHQDIRFPFLTHTVMFLNEGTGVIEASFNGTDVHTELNSADLSKQMIFPNRVIQKVWLRVKTGSSGPISVRVEAWSIA